MHSLKHQSLSPLLTADPIPAGHLIDLRVGQGAEVAMPAADFRQPLTNRSLHSMIGPPAQLDNLYPPSGAPSLRFEFLPDVPLSFPCRGTDS
jgi:hypothetical protein